MDWRFEPQHSLNLVYNRGFPTITSFCLTVADCSFYPRLPVAISLFYAAHGLLHLVLVPVGSKRYWVTVKHASILFALVPPPVGKSNTISLQSLTDSSQESWSAALLNVGGDRVVAIMSDPSGPITVD